MTLINMTGKDRSFSSWLSMMRRCFISADGSHKNYGWRGITVCERWRSCWDREDQRTPRRLHGLEGSFLNSTNPQATTLAVDIVAASAVCDAEQLTITPAEQERIALDEGVDYFSAQGALDRWKVLSA